MKNRHQIPLKSRFSLHVKRERVRGEDKLGKFGKNEIGYRNPVWSWGKGADGQGGCGDRRDHLNPTLVPSFCEDQGEAVVEVDGGTLHSLFLTETGTVFACGSGRRGQLGTGRDGSAVQSASPYEVPHFAAHGGVAHIAAGAMSSYCVASSGQVFAWGCGKQGRLGTGDEETRRIPTPVPLLGPRQRVVQLAAGSAHAMALTLAGAIFSWGCNSKGQLGVSDTRNRSSPCLIDHLGWRKRKCVATYIAAGAFHSGAVVRGFGVDDNEDCNEDVAQDVFTWGCGDERLGLVLSQNELTAESGVVLLETDTRAERNKLSPCLVLGLRGKGVAQIALGTEHGLAIADGGIAEQGKGKIGSVYSLVYVWGKNSYGQLGIRDTITRPSPVLLKHVKNVVSVRAGARFSMAATMDGNLLTWGDGTYGQNGHGDKLVRTLPHEIDFCKNAFPRAPPMMRKVSVIGTGQHHSIAVTTLGTHWMGYRAQVLKGYGWTPLHRLMQGGLSGSVKTSSLIKPPTFVHDPTKFPARATGSITKSGVKPKTGQEEVGADHPDPLIRYGGSINHAVSGSWYASIKIGKKAKWLGSFKTETEARTAYAEAARDNLKDPTLMRLISFVPPPQHVLKLRAARAKEREEARGEGGDGIDEANEDGKEEEEGKDEEKEVHFPVIETPLPPELPINAEAAARAEQEGEMKIAAGHRRRSVTTGTAKRRDEIKNTMSDRDLWQWGIQGATGAGRLQWTKEAVLGSHQWMRGKSGTEKDKEARAASEVVRAKDDYRKSMRDWYFAAKHKARIEEKERKRRELYSGKGKGKGKAKNGELARHGPGNKMGLRDKPALDDDLARIRVLVRSSELVGERELQFPLDLRLTAQHVLLSLVERGELPKAADHTTHAVMLVREGSKQQPKADIMFMHIKMEGAARKGKDRTHTRVGKEHLPLSLRGGRENEEPEPTLQEQGVNESSTLVVVPAGWAAHMS